MIPAGRYRVVRPDHLRGPSRPAWAYPRAWRGAAESAPYHSTRATARVTARESRARRARLVRDREAVPPV